MATMVNLVPIEVKPNAASQNISKKDSTKGDKSAVGFAKLLNNQTDKNQNDGSNAKEDAATAQTILQMIGMALPVAFNTMANNQSNNDKLANNLITDGTFDTSKVQLVNTNLVGQINNGLDLTTGKDASQNQLAALLTKMSDLNTSADNNKVSEFTQAQLQDLLQGKQAMVGQAQVADVAAQKIDLNIANNPLLGAVTSAVVMENNNGVGKANDTQSNSKKVGVGTNMSPDTAQLVDADEVNVKPVTAPQSIVNVVDAMTSDSKTNTLLLGDKELLNTESILPDQTIKPQDAFASLLNQQVVKNDTQVVVPEAKQVLQQPLNDPYNVASQIVDQARLVNGQKNTEMIIQLKPEHLGELTLKVTVESGVVSASFHSNNSEVRNIIEASLPQLKQDLSNQGLKIENVGVYAGLGEFFSNGQQRESQGKSEVKVQNKKTEEDFLDALESTNPLESSVDGSGVDYRI